MGSTDNSSLETGASRQPSLFDGSERSTGEHEHHNQPEPYLSARPELRLPADASAGSEPPANAGVSAAQTSFEPLWAQRLKLVVFVLFCVELGMLLAVLPWTPVWTHNNLLGNHQVFRAIFQHNFTRGAVTGIGVIDVWVGILSAVQYRDKK